MFGALMEFPGEHDLVIRDCRVQIYDSASKMSGLQYEYQQFTLPRSLIYLRNKAKR